jgi:16S rRNA (uracil1498-N3)-methyltransferase
MRYKHTFALFVGDIAIIIDAKTLIIRDKILLQRILRILRLAVGDSCVLFNRIYVWKCIVQTVSMRGVVMQVVETTTIQPLQPKISWGVPLLEPADFEEAIYTLTAMGAFSLQPLITQKSHRQQLSPKELQRLERIMIAAAEQAKQYALPRLNPVTTLPLWLKQQTDIAGPYLFFDPQGIPCLQAITKVQSLPHEHIICLVGPEGDLTLQEKVMIKEHFLFVALTPSILRASHAITVSMGILRSCVR